MRSTYRQQDDLATLSDVLPQRPVQSLGSGGQQIADLQNPAPHRGRGNPVATGHVTNMSLSGAERMRKPIDAITAPRGVSLVAKGMPPAAWCAHPDRSGRTGAR
ncbi:hypothetical protein GCM10010365_57800 [Streptomyces poonensis]|uniref:Uncharacterized protein n=1 Tax=Streptomyces poonensis TaxID=68255 RepID=A0A918Q0L9_9ACTN|nr:hypothetical protein GCM10010365_57800 [Streptomyces poonensis]